MGSSKFHRRGNPLSATLPAPRWRRYHPARHVLLGERDRAHLVGWDEPPTLFAVGSGGAARTALGPSGARPTATAPPAPIRSNCRRLSALSRTITPSSRCPIDRDLGGSPLIAEPRQGRQRKWQIDDLSLHKGTSWLATGQSLRAAASVEHARPAADGFVPAADRQPIWSGLIATNRRGQEGVEVEVLLLRRAQYVTQAR